MAELDHDDITNGSTDTGTFAYMSHMSHMPCPPACMSNTRIHIRHGVGAQPALGKLAAPLCSLGLCDPWTFRGYFRQARLKGGLPTHPTSTNETSFGMTHHGSNKNTQIDR